MIQYCLNILYCLFICASYGATLSAFAPLWLQQCTAHTATLHASVPLNTLFDAWAQLTHQNLILTGPKTWPTLSLNIEHTDWNSLIPRLIRDYDLSLSQHNHLLTLSPQHLQTYWMPLHFTQPQQWSIYQKHIKTQCATCTIHLDPNHHGLWLSTLPTHLKTLQQQIKALDIEPHTLTLDIKLIQMNQSWLEQWGHRHTHHPNPLEIFLNTLSQTLTFPLNLHHAQQPLLEQLLSALKQNHQGKLTAQATLNTQAHETVTLHSGLMMPYDTKDSRGRLETHFKPVRLSIQITPNIQYHRIIDLQIDITHNTPQNNPDEESKAPTILSNEIHTHTLIKNNTTLILSTLNTLFESHRHASISPLAHLPIVGALFRPTSQDHSSTRYIIAIKVRINKRHGDARITQHPHTT